MSTSQFHLFAAALAAHFAQMSKGELYRVAIDGQAVWDAYLAAFPEGTNPIYRVRTEHDGSYDRNVVRKIGNVVSIDADGRLVTVWDLPNLPEPYAAVAKALSDMIAEAPIETLFRTKERNFGYVSTIEELEGGGTQKWFHFHADVDRKHQTPTPDKAIGDANTTVQVFRRGLEELTPAAFDTVIDLIESGALYRGDEFKRNVTEFRALQRFYQDVLAEQTRTIALWNNYTKPFARIRNTAIGTLLQDLSEGMELEAAVRRYEAVTAPTNYRRPKALITQSMINQAVAKIRELGLETALQRRFARMSDLSVNNVHWVNNTAKGAMKDGLTALLQTALKPGKAPAFPEELSAEVFLRDVLPTAQALEVFFANPLRPNLMSLTAPVHADAGALFRWDNGFAWAYHGDITDSIKEKVKAAGGNVNAKLRVSLAWSNYDDLDLHAMCPEGHVYYGNKLGILDVDMNAGGGQSRSPVENLSWRAPADGTYDIFVRQFYRRENVDIGFTLEVENNGRITQYSYPERVEGQFHCLSITVKNGAITDVKVVERKLTGQGISREAWGLQTEQFVPVETVLASPNHWDGQASGNKHWFFILEGAKNPEPVRGIFNEYLKPELDVHRKVFEVLGAKTKCEPTNDQLSGLGFSTTKRDSVVFRVTDSKSTRSYKVNF